MSCDAAWHSVVWNCIAWIDAVVWLCCVVLCGVAFDFVIRAAYDVVSNAQYRRKFVSIVGYECGKMN